MTACLDRGIDRTDAPRTVNVTFAGQPTGIKPYQRIEIASGKNGEKPAVTRETLLGAKRGKGSWTLSPHSVTVLTFGE